MKQTLSDYIVAILHAMVELAAEDACSEITQR